MTKNNNTEGARAEENRPTEFAAPKAPSSGELSAIGQELARYVDVLRQNFEATTVAIREGANKASQGEPSTENVDALHEKAALKDASALSDFIAGIRAWFIEQKPDHVNVADLAEVGAAIRAAACWAALSHRNWGVVRRKETAEG